VVAPGDGSDPVQVIDARDLAEWTIRMVEGRSFGTFNAVGPAYRVPMADLLCGIRAATTAGAELTWIPAAFLEEHGAQPWSDMPVWVPSGPETAGFGTRSNARAIAAGLTFRPLAKTALDTLAWWKTLPAERQATLRAGLTPERERDLLAAWMGGYLATHGWSKLQMALAGDFALMGDPIGLGARPGLYLLVFAELGCAVLVMAGLATRLAAGPPIVGMAVAAFVAHGADPWTMEQGAKLFMAGQAQFWGSKQPALMFLLVFLALVFTGAGRFSADALIAAQGRRQRSGQALGSSA
jgi:uncharacterized membrane protein YphA (DoxX/SURF4 family)